jgi:peptidase YpeB-like protein
MAGNLLVIGAGGNTPMKSGIAVLTFAAALGFTPAVVHAAGPKSTQAELQKEARISMEKARSIALKKVPHGKIASEELEREHGKLIYSFDVKTNRPGVTEVNVDAMNGKVIDVHHETPANESAEKKQETKEKSAAKH